MVMTIGRARLAGPDDRSAADVLAERLDVLADRRWRAASSFTYDGVEGVASDDLANNRLNNAIQGLQLPGVPAGLKVGWELTASNFVQMGLAELQDLGLAMLTHVQACWAVQAHFSAQLIAAADEGLDAIYAVDLETGWPAG